MPFWRRRRTFELPEDWEDTVAATVVRWWDHDLDERTRLRDLMVRLLSEKRWEAARGFELTDEVRLVVAAQACQLILGLDFDHYREVGTIIVAPTTQVLTGERAVGTSNLVTDAPVPVLGRAAHATGPVVIAWDETRRNARHPERGYNVVFHEFAHKLDMLDHVVDGTPPLSSGAVRDRWVAVCTAEFEALRDGRGSPLLRDYAATNAGEFFAVATEVFFDRGVELRDDRPDLYEVLAAYYRQDPAARTPPEPDGPGER